MTKAIEERNPQAFRQGRPTDYRAHRYYFEKYNHYRGYSGRIAQLADEIDKRIKEGTLKGTRVPPGPIWQLTPEELYEYREVFSDEALKNELKHRMGSLTPDQLRRFGFTSQELTTELHRREARIRERASKEYRRAHEGFLTETKETEEEYINRRLTEELSPLSELIEEVETQEAGGLKEVDPDKGHKGQCPPTPPSAQP